MSKLDRHDGAFDGAADVGDAGTLPDSPDVRAEENLVPTWLAALVLVLLLAVMGVGGYVLRGVVSGQHQPATAQQFDVERWVKAVRANPKDVQAHLGLGYAYEMAGTYNRSLAEYDAVIKLDPNNTAAYYNRGVVYLKTGRGVLGERSLWRVLNIDKTHALAAKALGDYYAGKHQYRSLLVAVEPAVQAHPEMADLQYLAGTANENIGNRQAAIDRYKLAQRYSPDLPGLDAALKRMGVTGP